MAVHDRNTARHHRPASIARPKSLVGALDQEPLPLPRPAQPCADRTAEASSGRQDRRARGAGDPSDHQWDSRGAAQQRLAPEQKQRTAPPLQTDIAALEKCEQWGAATDVKKRPPNREGNPASGIPTATRSTFRSTDGRTESVSYLLRVPALPGGVSGSLGWSAGPAFPV